jgi:hypothetical protein
VTKLAVVILWSIRDGVFLLCLLAVLVGKAPRATAVIRKAPGKDSMRLRRKVAAWDDDFLASLIAA